MATIQDQLNDIQTAITALASRVGIKSIQNISAMPYSSTSVTDYADITIGAVDVSKSFVVLRSSHGIYAYGGGSGSLVSVDYYFTVTLRNSTTVRVAQSSNRGMTHYLSATIIECY